jgi:ribose/xylose/arabinose/galactoside ABC-type transport system permease subunit
MLAAVAGLVLSGYIGYVDRYLGQGFELDSIAASVVGGVSLAGGKGGVGGALAGVGLLAVLTNIVIFLNLGESAQLVVKGGVIIAAVALQAKRLLETGPTSA